MFCVFDNFSLILTMQVFGFVMPNQVLPDEFKHNHLYET